MRVKLPMSKKLPWLAAGVLGIFVVVGLKIGTIWQRPTAETSSPSYSIATVQRGDLTLTASGTGSLIAGQNADLSFPVSGTVGELKVRVGEQVSAGQVLAVLAEANELKVTVQEKQLALQEAQQALSELLNGADKRLAQALADRAVAQSAYEEAKKNLRRKGVPRCSQDQIVSYYYKYANAQNNVNIWEDYLESGKTGYGTDYILKTLAPMRKERDLAYANLTYCQGYTEQEILESEANLKLAEANLSQAEKTYQDLLAHAGIDPDEVSIAEAEVKNAEAQLKKAQAELKGASLVTPMDGTVIAINADEGEAVTGRDADESEGEVIFLTLADLEHPLVRVYIDETDLQSFAVGCSAEVTFDAIPGRVFEGVVTQVSPVLVAMGNVNALEGLVKLENAVLTPQKTLVLGLSGTVDISCKKTSNVLLVPVAAVHEEDSSVYVYVLNQSGEKEKREIEVGARSSTFVEVRSGLQEGERVIIQ